MKFSLEPNQLTITLEGFEQVWALKRRLQIPHFAIESVEYLDQVPTMQDYQGRLRVPRTFFLWKFSAGTYQKGRKREFRYVKMQQPGIIAITCKPETLPYDRVQLSCSSEIAQNIVDWWQKSYTKE